MQAQSRRSRQARTEKVNGDNNTATRCRNGWSRGEHTQRREGRAPRSRSGPRRAAHAAPTGRTDGSLDGDAGVRQGGRTRPWDPPRGGVLGMSRTGAWRRRRAKDRATRGRKRRQKRAWSPGEAAQADESRTGQQARGVGNQCEKHVRTRAAAEKTGREGDSRLRQPARPDPREGGGRPYAVLGRVGRGHRRPCLLRIGGMPVGGKNFTSTSAETPKSERER